MGSSSRLLAAIQKQEFLLAIGVIGLIILFFVPLPPWALDFLFAVNITLGLMILLTVLFIQKALEFTAFPMLLLVTTTFRLALNVASTRLILQDGHQTTAAAGKIIETFGAVIIGGNFVIGLIIFLILIIVNFVVITKGSGRIAEVAARFTLDSLPGKQLAIDSDLNAGLINEDQARSRRSELEQETGFFGAMDGASKFVRGDAIAGLIITGLNIVVGIIVGTAQHGLSIGDSANRYLVLTIGDGLVAYIPALTISIAAGLLVSKSGTIGSAGNAVLGQLAKNPQALFVASGLMVLISFLPNMPVLVFWILGAGLGYLGRIALKVSDKVISDAAEEAAKPAASVQGADGKPILNADGTPATAGAADGIDASGKPAEEPMASVLHIDTLRLELGYGLLPLIDEARGGRLTDQIKAMRRQTARDIGFVVPSLRIQDNMELKPGEYALYIKDIEAGRGSLEAGKMMAMDPTGTAPKIAGDATHEPTFGLPAIWIEEGQKEEANFNGYTVVDNATVIVTHLTEVIKDNLSELLTRNELQKLLDELRGEHEALIDDVVPEKVALGTLQKVLQNLLGERVSIRDLPTILEALSDMAGSRNLAAMTEIVRQRLGRQLTTQYNGPDGIVPIVSLSAGWEKEFSQSIVDQGEDKQLAMAPDKVQAFLRTARETFEKQLMAGAQPILLTSTSARPFARMLLHRSLPSIGVLSQSELHPKAKIKTLATI